MKAWLKTPWNLIKCIDLLWVSSQVRGWVLDRKLVLVLWNVRWFGQHKLNTSCPKSDDAAINAGFETDKRLFLLCYCCNVYSPLNWFTDVSLSNTGWEPIHANMLNAAPHIAFFFPVQRRNEQQFFDVESRLSWWSQHWQTRYIRRTWPPLQATSISCRWRCSRTPEMSVRLPDWLWVFSPTWPGSKVPVEKGGFALSLCVALSASAFLFFSRHSGATAFSWRRHASPSALKKEMTKHTLLVTFPRNGSWGMKEKETTHGISWSHSEKAGNLQNGWEWSWSVLKTRLSTWDCKKSLWRSKQILRDYLQVVLMAGWDGVVLYAVAEVFCFIDTG